MNIRTVSGFGLSYLLLEREKPPMVREPVIDADGHIIESDAEIFQYLPPPYRARLTTSRAIDRHHVDPARISGPI